MYIYFDSTRLEIIYLTSKLVSFDDYLATSLCCRSVKKQAGIVERIDSLSIQPDTFQ